MIAALLDYLVLALRATFWVVVVGTIFGTVVSTLGFFILCALSGAGEGSEEKDPS